MHAGFYAVEWMAHQWQEFVWQLQQEGQLREQPERMGLFTLVRRVRRREPLPKTILVLHFDRAMYNAFWLNGGEGSPQQALSVVESIVREIRRTLSLHRDWLQRQAPTILLPFGSLENTAEGWWAGYKHGSTGTTQRLFRLEWLIPVPSLLEPKEIVKEAISCYAPL